MFADTDRNPLSVTELTARIKQMLEAGFAKVEVSGEVSRLTRPSSGHFYFTIKDAHAAISAVIWRSTVLRLKNLPEEGGEFVFSGHISLYEPRGSYQLVVSRVEVAGFGKLAAEFERRKQEFAGRGWFDIARKQPIPPLPQHIGIVTSPTAAAFEDVKKVLATRPAWLQITLAPALVQGTTAPASISAAIRKITAMDRPPDIILLVRGGGSIEDLWCFNDETVVKAIVDCPIPVISGIGHEIDTTLADLAADIRAATPSNAAEICCPASNELRKRMPKLAALNQQLRQRLLQMRRDQASLIQRQTHAWLRHTDSHHHRVGQLQSRLEHAAHVALTQLRMPLRLLEKRLAPLHPTQQLQHQRLLQTRASMDLHQNMLLLLRNRQQSLADISAQLKAQAHHIQLKRQQLNVSSGKLRELDPTRVLERGYNMSYTADGRLITHVSELTTGDSLFVHFRDGTATTTVKSIQEKSA
ncbi:MAG: exodeoxyribonuclease VII large subunit [Mariprofundus sp.]|nr:exodeoxyribonuclease VII large subunit [Mariprofundus sp.]